MTTRLGPHYIVNCMINIYESYDNDSLEAAKKLIEEYTEFLGFDLNFQDFAEEMAEFPGKYAPPEGCLLLAKVNGRVAGCIALRKIDNAACEMKRLFVRSEFRGRGVGRMLVEELLTRAREKGYRAMRLDTVPQLDSANALYEKIGFKDIEPYYHNPIPGARFMEITL
ncbi:MAG: GNAT family N-acetyltransferase [Candidatus Zixiibacteriota bacterium]